MNNLLQIKKRIDSLVSRAFYIIFLKDKENNVWVSNIDLDYSCCEDDFDPPIIEVSIGYTWLNGSYELKVTIDLDRPDEFIIGYLVHAFEEDAFEEENNE